MANGRKSISPSRFSPSRKTSRSYSTDGNVLEMVKGAGFGTPPLSLANSSPIAATIAEDVKVAATAPGSPVVAQQQAAAERLRLVSVPLNDTPPAASANAAASPVMPAPAADQKSPLFQGQSEVRPVSPLSPKTASEVEDALLALEAVAKRFDAEIPLDDREWQTAVILSPEAEKTRDDALFEAAKEAINKYDLEWLKVILGPEIFSLRQNYYEKFKKFQWTLARLEDEESFYLSAKAVIDQQLNSYKHIKWNDFLLKIYNEKLESKKKAVFEPDAKEFEKKAQGSESELLQETEKCGTIKNQIATQEAKRDQYNLQIQQLVRAKDHSFTIESLIKKRQEIIEKINVNRVRLAAINSKIGRISQDKSKFLDQLRIYRSLKTLDANQISYYFTKNMPIADFLQCHALEKEHMAAKAAECVLDGDYPLRMKNKGYELVVTHTRVPEDKEIETDKIYLYNVFVGDKDSNKQSEILWSIRCKAKNIHGKIEEIVFDDLGPLKSLMLKNKELKETHQETFFKHVMRYGYLRKIEGGYQKHLERAVNRENTKISEEMLVLTPDEAKAVVARIEIELDHKINRLYDSLEDSLKRPIHQADQKDNQSHIQDQVRVRYLQPLLDFHKIYLKQVFDKFIGVEKSRTEHFKRFLSDGSFIRFKEKLNLEEKIKELQKRNIEAKKQQNKIKETFERDKEKAEQRFREMAKDWLKDHYVKLDKSYVAEKSGDQLIEEAVKAISSPIDLKEVYMPQRPLTYMRDSDGNTLMHYAMEKYGEALVGANLPNTTSADKEKLKIALDMVKQLHIFGCSPYMKNKKEERDEPGKIKVIGGLTAYEHGTKTARNHFIAATQNKFLGKEKKFTLPDDKLIEISLRQLSTHSEASACFKDVFLWYIKENDNQLNGPLSFLYRLFLDEGIKELRRDNMREFMKDLYVGEYKMSDQFLIDRINKLKDTIKTGPLGRSALFSRLDEICRRIDRNEISSLSVPVDEITIYENALKAKRESLHLETAYQEREKRTAAEARAAISDKRAEEETRKRKDQNDLMRKYLADQGLAVPEWLIPEDEKNAIPQGPINVSAAAAAPRLFAVNMNANAAAPNPMAAAAAGGRLSVADNQKDTPSPKSPSG